MSLLIRITLCVVVINLLYSSCFALRGSKGYGSSKEKGYTEMGKPKTFVGTSSGLPSQNTTRRGLGISAWGIVTLIISLILAGMGLYYFALCYPILCKKSRKYDMMGMPNVAV